MPGVGVGELGTVSGLLRIAPHGPTNPVGGLPLVSRVDMPMQYGDGVAQDFVVDPAESVFSTGVLHSLSEERQVEQERRSPLPVEVGQVVHGWVVCEQQRVTGQVLRVADDGEAAR